MMRRFGISRETIRTFLSPVEGGGSGLGPDALSAYADYAADMLHPLQSDDTDQMFPGGNTGIARLMVKTLIPKSIAGDGSMEAVCRNSINFGARPAESPARIRLNVHGGVGETRRRSGKPICLSGLHPRRGNLSRQGARRRHGGRQLDDQAHRPRPSRESSRRLRQFYRSPCMMANVAVRHWRFLYKMGMSGFRWFEGVGNYTEVRKRRSARNRHPQSRFADGAPDQGAVCPSRFADRRSGQRGRAQLLATSFAHYERTFREQLSDMFGGRLRPAPGHCRHHSEPLGTRLPESAARLFLRHGRPACPARRPARGPLRPHCVREYRSGGSMDHRCSILEAERAVGQLLGQV